MALLDIPAPLFTSIDGALDFLPAFLRLSLWSAVAGALSMLLYALVSPQKTIAEVKGRLREAQGQLAASDESFDEVLGLARRTLGLSFKHLGLVFAPALLSALPLICIMAWASTQFGYRFPESGEPVAVKVQPPEAAARLYWEVAAGSETPALDGAGWQLAWPGGAEGATLRVRGGAALLDVPPPAPVPTVHKRLWWNSLLGNPAGYLPGDSPAEVVQLDLPPRRFIPFGPGWVGSWLTLFLLVSVAGALVTKKVFGIH